MSEIISINGKEVAKIMYKGSAVITCSMVDEIHGKNPKASNNALLRHKSRFVEGKHYYDLPFEVWSEFAENTEKMNQTPKNGFGVPSRGTPNIKTRGGHTGNMIFLTEIGYAKLIKVFDDDLAWDIYDLMVENYFNPPLQRIAVPDDPQQVLGMRAWLRARLKALGAETKDARQMLNECEEKLDHTAPPFIRPSNEQQSLPLR